jgi:hypothetical protein
MEPKEKGFARFNTQTYKSAPRRRAYPFPMNLPHLPALRRGKPYASLDQNDIVAHATGEKIATISQVNAGIIRKDLAKISEARAALKNFTSPS